MANLGQLITNERYDMTVKILHGSTNRLTSLVTGEGAVLKIRPRIQTTKNDEFIALVSV